MIQIDMKMPQRCAECPCFSDSIYGHCNVKDIWLGADDGAWFSDHRPNWCPLQEQDGKPMIENERGWNCPSCGMKLIGKTASGYPCDLIDLPNDEPIHFCPMCGQAVKWE